MKKVKHKIIVAGSGVFGTAIAERLAWNRNNDVSIYSRDQNVIDDINNNNQNSKCYPTRFLNTSIKCFGDLEQFNKADCVFLAIPSKSILDFSASIEKYLKKDCLIINLAKGMNNNGTFITDQIPTKRKASMKGPTFAIELLNGFPSAFTFGGDKEDFDKIKNLILPHTMIALDYTPDIKAVELLSVLKNLYAIAIGLVSGRYNSPNVDFLIYTKAVNEIRGLLNLYDLDSNNIFKYCGLGDLGLTGLNDLSRNRTLGLLIGKGFSPDTSNKSSTVVEGYRTIKVMKNLIDSKNLIDEYPIIKALNKLMYEEENIQDFLQAVFR